MRIISCSSAVKNSFLGDIGYVSMHRVVDNMWKGSSIDEMVGPAKSFIVNLYKERNTW